MCKKIVYSIIISLLVISITFGGIQTYRLERSRFEYLQLREQYERVTNKQQEIGVIIAGTGDILQQSIDSIAELKRVIGEIRENYEKMESIIYNLNDSIGNSISDSNSEEINE